MCAVVFWQKKIKNFCQNPIKVVFWQRKFYFFLPKYARAEFQVAPFFLQYPIDYVKENYTENDSLAGIARDIGVKRQTLQAMFKDEKKIRKAMKEGKNIDSKRARKAQHPQLEKELFKWYKNQRKKSPGTVVTGDLIQVKFQ